MITQRLISSDAIAAEFGPISELRPLHTGEFDLAAIRYHARAHTLWTLVDGPYGPLLTSGHHLVNRLAYFSSAKPVRDDVIVDEAPDKALVTCEICDAAWDTDLDERCPYCADAGG
ncbi:MAG: hypothetical protein Q8K82_14290 [Gemmatimonadaceae bacterium]|nr:hypothetical protein [Gemmatimonadaceae bacterium]